MQYKLYSYGVLFIYLFFNLIIHFAVHYTVLTVQHVLLILKSDELPFLVLEGRRSMTLLRTIILELMKKKRTVRKRKRVRKTLEVMTALRERRRTTKMRTVMKKRTVKMKLEVTAMRTRTTR